MRIDRQIARRMKGWMQTDRQRDEQKDRQIARHTTTDRQIYADANNLNRYPTYLTEHLLPWNKALKKVHLQTVSELRGLVNFQLNQWLIY